MTPVLDWAAANPWLAFGLSFPVTMTIATCSWMAAEVISRGIGLMLQLANLVSNTIVLLVRGHAPYSVEAAPEDDKDDDTIVK